MSYQYPPQQQPPWQPPQPPRLPRRKGHVLRNFLLGIGGFFVLIIIIAAAAGGGSPKAKTGTDAAASSQPAAVPKTSAAAKPKHVRQTVTYVVTGSPAQVTYGPAGSSLNGHVPMRITRTLHNPQFYSISAQLQGGGAVACKLMVNGKAISKATASGGYNIASCEISQDPISGKWSDTNGA